jgi:glycosyltransferase involved in cell wall biosynthesis
MDKFRRLPESYYRLLPGMSREELSDYLSVADCIVIPSLSEGFGLAAVEACTLKKRVVATDVGSLPEVVSGEYVLVKPGSPEALAEGCCRAFKGDVSYGPPKGFRWEKTVNQCRKIYGEILDA